MKHAKMLPGQMQPLSGIDGYRGLSRLAGVDRLHVDDDVRLSIFDAELVVAGGQSTIQVTGREYGPPTQVYLGGSVRCTTYGRVQVIAEQSATVYGYHDGTVTLLDQSQGWLYNRCKGVVRDQARGYGYDATSWSLYQNGSVELYDSANAWATDMAVLVAYGAVDISARQSCHVIVADGVQAQSLTLRDSTRLTIPAGVDPEAIALFSSLSDTIEVIQSDLPASIDGPELLDAQPEPPTGYQLGGSPAEDWALADDRPHAASGDGASLATPTPTAPEQSSAAPTAPTPPAAPGPPAAPTPPAPPTSDDAGPASADPPPGPLAGALPNASGHLRPPVDPTGVDTSITQFDPAEGWRPIHGGVPHDSSPQPQPQPMPTPRHR